MVAKKKMNSQLELFLPLVGDVGLHDQQEMMAFPFFSLSKKRTKPLIYEDARGNYVEVTANAKYGMATIWDYDILLFAASHIAAAKNKGLEPSRRMRVTPYDVLKFSHRGTSGREYEQLKKAFQRLQSTTVSTSIRDDEKSRKNIKAFSWISEWHIEEDTKTGKPVGIEFIVSDWFFDGVVNNKMILTITPEYFELSGGYERWLYRLVRKHGGKQEKGWWFSLRQLHEKCGTTQRFSDFKRDIIEVIEKNNLPDYHLKLFVDEKDKEQDPYKSKNPLLAFYHKSFVPSPDELSEIREKLGTVQ